MYRQERRPPKCLRVVGDNARLGAPEANALCFAPKRAGGKQRVDEAKDAQMTSIMQAHVSVNEPTFMSFHKQEKETYKRNGVVDRSLSADPSHLYKAGYRYKVTLPAECSTTLPIRRFARFAGVFECNGHTVQLLNQPKNVNEITLSTAIPCSWVTHFHRNGKEDTEATKAQWTPLTADTWTKDEHCDCHKDGSREKADCLTAKAAQGA